MLQEYAEKNLQRKRRFKRRVRVFLKHPLFLTILTCVFTAFIATWYQSKLADDTKNRELLIIRRQRTADAVKSVTDLIFERVFRANMVTSSLKRSAPIDELKDRKKAYDEVFVKYNSNIQSNLFRIREMFDTTEYTDFEAMMEGGLRSLMETEDNCITAAYDDATANDAVQKHSNLDGLMHCKPATNILHPNAELPEDISVDDLRQKLVHCEYVFTDALFRTVERAANQKQLALNTPAEVAKACQLSNPSAVPKH